MDKNSILGDAMSVKKYVQSVWGGGGGHYGLKYFILFPTTRGVKGL